MENTGSRVLIETVVKKSIQEAKVDPERQVRKIVDFALEHSNTQNKKHFFQVAHDILKQENCPYYVLLKDTISYVDADRILKFGMNLCYNSCVYGMKQLHEKEQEQHTWLPWMIPFKVNDDFISHMESIKKVIEEGKKTGIYTYAFDVGEYFDVVVPFIQDNEDCAFFLICDSNKITTKFLDELAYLKNIMVVLAYNEQEQGIRELRDMGIPYSIYLKYSQADLENIQNGDFFMSAQQASPFFTFLIPSDDCLQYVQEKVYNCVIEARNKGLYHTIPFEFMKDSSLIDLAISDGLYSHTNVDYYSFK